MKVCTCWAHHRSGQGSADEDCPVHGRVAEELSSIEDVEPYPASPRGERPSWDEWALGLAERVAARADCTRRRVGAVILDVEHRVVSTGFNGAPSGQPGCLTDGACPRGRLGHTEQPGLAGYEQTACIALHAELNAVIYAGREQLKGATIYVTCEPCYLCQLVIAAAKIDRIVVAPDGG